MGGQVLQLQPRCLVVPPFALVGPAGAAIAFGCCRRWGRRSHRGNIDGILAPGCDMSPFLRSGRCGGSYSLSVAEAWGVGVGGGWWSMFNLSQLYASLPSSPHTLPCPLFWSVPCPASKTSFIFLVEILWGKVPLSKALWRTTLPPWAWCLLLRKPH